MINAKEIRTKSNLKLRAVYSAVCYFDIFNFPVKLNEIQKYCEEEVSNEELKESLEELKTLNKIREEKEYYFLTGSDQNIINIRHSNEIYLTTKFNKIKKYAAFVNKFPFVEATYVSGSVSKGILSEDGDVDYFIIAKPGRVWLCRTILVAFKKIFLLNSRKYFCVNYFIDTNNLRVPDENLFVATEIKTLVPVINNAITQNFSIANSWADKFLPNHRTNNSPLITEGELKPLISKWIETIFAKGFGEKADNFFFKKTLNRWQKKFPHFNQNDFDLNMRSYKNVSKHHPQGQQNRVLQSLVQRMKKFD